MIKGWKKSVVTALSVSCIVATNANAQVDETAIKAATASGAQWLAEHQNSDGSWGTSDQVGVTGLALSALLHHAMDSKYGAGSSDIDSPFDPDYMYEGNVSKAFQYLFTKGFKRDIEEQEAGDPDTNEDGQATYFGVTADDVHHRNYQTGIALATICQAVELDRVIDIPDGDYPMEGKTYLEVAEDTMNYVAWSQYDEQDGNSRGGWGYAGSGNGYLETGGGADNSPSGYAVLGLFLAEDTSHGCGLTLPGFLRTELDYWVNYIQSVTGGSGYTSPEQWVNILKTGNLIQQMVAVGDDSSTERAQAALNYMATHWDETTLDPGWKGTATTSSYQAAFTVMKGLQAMGVEEFSGINWYDDFVAEILPEQHLDGAWRGDPWDVANGVLSTSWAILTLERAAPADVNTGGTTPGSAGQTSSSASAFTPWSMMLFIAFILGAGYYNIRRRESV